MKKFLLTISFMLVSFTTTIAHPFKTDKELYNFYAKIDKEIEVEFKKDFKKLFNERKNNAVSSFSNGTEVFQDDDYIFEFTNGSLSNIGKKNVLNNQYMILIRFHTNGKVWKIFAVSTNDRQFYGTKKEFSINGKLLREIPYYAGKLNGTIKEYYENGNILRESYAIDNKQNKQEKTYYENGQIAFIKNFKDDVQVGEYISYYTDGQLKIKGTYKNGKKDGEFKTYLIDGRSAGSIFYKDDTEVKSTLTNYMEKDSFFAFNGDITKPHIDINDPKAQELQEEMKKSGGFHTYGIDTYPTDIIMRMVPYNMNGQYDGVFFQYFESGNLAQEGKYVNGKGEGEYIWYHENGNILQKINYVNDKKEGKGTWFFPNGKIAQTVNFVNDKEEGELIEYYENGNIKEKLFYVDGKKEGEALYYSKNGKLLKKEVYKNGIRQN